MHIQTSLPENCICCLYFTLCQLIVSKLCAQQQDCSAGMSWTTSSHRHLDAWLLLNCQQTEELPSATVAQHIGGSSGLEDSICESEQPR